MSLIHFEGFEALDVAALRKKYPLGASFPTGQTITALGGGRNGGRAMQANGGTAAEARMMLSSGPGTLIIGGAFYCPSGSGTRSCFQFFDYNSTTGTSSQQCKLDILYSTRALHFFTGAGGLLAQSADFVVPMDEWFYLEAKITFADAGSIEARINGTTVINASPVDTKVASGSARCNLVYVFAQSTSGKVDDIYICDTAGSMNNDFLGDMRIDLLQPNADGTYAQFTPSTGTDHFATVDEDPMATADYNSSTTTGHRDTYAMTNLTPIAGSDIKGLYVGILASKTDSGFGTLKPSIRVGGANYDGTSIPLSNAGIMNGTFYESNPATSAAWTEGDVNGIEAGVVVA